MVSFYCFEFTHEQGCSGYKANKRDAMKLFHGSNVEVVTPRLMPMVRALDFGRAFYLTSDFEQASRWAKTSVLRRGEGVAVVNLYFKGAYSEEEALRRLLPQRLRDQFAIKTEAALACLTFLEGRTV